MARADMYSPTEDVYVTREGLRTPSPRYVVPATHKAAYLLVAAHNEIPRALADRYGLLAPPPETAPDPADAPPPAAPTPEDSPPLESATPSADEVEDEPKGKAKRPVADKAVHHAEDK